MIQTQMSGSGGFQGAARKGRRAVTAQEMVLIHAFLPPATGLHKGQHVQRQGREAMARAAKKCVHRTLMLRLKCILEVRPTSCTRPTQILDILFVLGSIFCPEQADTH